MSVPLFDQQANWESNPETSTTRDTAISVRTFTPLPLAGGKLGPLVGIEPTTDALQEHCSTAEL
jgi:hypothetical protein